VTGGKDMSHVTKKVAAKKARNNLNRGVNGFNTGTRDMGYASTNAAKAAAHKKSLKRDLEDYRFR
jgi:hypothetical protein